jgi:4-amino-4-deoxy-L-arabinose transferase-like glycosyltransferase
MSGLPWSVRERWLCVVLVLLAWTLRAWTVVEYEREHPQAAAPVIDERSYDGWAREIAAGDWLGREVYFQEPLYPYWLGGVYAVSGGSRSAARHLQAGAGALTVLLCYALARRLAGVRAAAAAAALLALYPPHWHLSALLLKENLFLPCVAALAWLGLVAEARVSRGAPSRLCWLGLGALAGAGALLRGNVLVLLPLVVAWPWLCAWGLRRGAALDALRRSASSIAALLLGLVLVLAPVALRNWRVGHVFALTTSGAGTNLYGGNNVQNPWGVATEFSWVRGIPEHEAGDWKHEAERRVGRALSPTEVSDYWMAEVWRSMREDPRLHASIFWNKLRLSLGPYEVPDNHCLAWDARYVAPLRLPLPGFALLGWLGISGVLLALLPRRGAPRADLPTRDAAVAWALGAAALAYLATVVLTVTSDRIRLGLVPLLAPFAGYAVLCLCAIARRPVALLACCAVAAAFAWTYAQPSASREDDLLERDYNQASYWAARPERRAEARALAESLQVARPRSSRVLTLLAELDWHSGAELLAQPGVRADPAQSRPILEQYYEPALDRLKLVLGEAGVSPRERFRAQRLAGLIQLDLGRSDVAERRFREALEFDPADAALRVWLGQALLGQAGKLDGAARVEKARAALQCLEAVPLQDAEVEALRARARAWIE